MTVWLATQTRAAINEALHADGGATYRQWLGRVLPHMGDAYRADDSKRGHLGMSQIGAECARAVALGFLWASADKVRGRKGEPELDATGRMLRLWNRGHLEEGRFIALLLTIGVKVYQQDEQGNQFRVEDLGGHYSGSLDAILTGVPDIPVGYSALGEFKTHNAKSFQKLVDEGVRVSKPLHYTQMMSYMQRRGLLYGLYCAVCKDDDELYFEVVPYEDLTPSRATQRAHEVIFNDRLPPRVKGASPGFYLCKYMCDHKDVCFHTVAPQRHCRTCQHIRPLQDGTWACTLTGELRSKEQQLAGCQDYIVADKFE